MGKKYPIAGMSDEYISITQGQYLTLSYVKAGYAPLEVRVNNSKGHSRILLKAIVRIPDMQPIEIDYNIFLQTTEISEIKRVLEKFQAI